MSSVHESGLVDHPQTYPGVGEGAVLDTTTQPNQEALTLGANRSPSASVVVGIPAYNEQESIAEVVTATRETADFVVVVDDGSSDETAARAAGAGGVVVRHEENRGYGAALKTLFKQAVQFDATHLVVIDADGQHDPADVLKLLETQETTGADIVIGSRFVEGSGTEMPRYRWAGLTVINALTNLCMGLGGSDVYIRDTQSGFRLYNRRAIASLATDEAIREGMNASLDIIFHARSHNYTIAETATTVAYDVANAHSQSPLFHGLSLMKTLLFKFVERH